MLICEPRMEGAALSPREAAFVTGLSEKTINQAIDRSEVETLPARRPEERERRLGFHELVYLRMRNRVGHLLSPEGKRQLRHELERVSRIPEHLPEGVCVGDLQVNLGKEVRTLADKLEQLWYMWSFISIRDDIRAGEPVVQGTRISVHVLRDLTAHGASRQELLEDYPSLTAESLEAAIAWAEMYPRRGRPVGTPWRDGYVIRRGR